MWSIASFQGYYSVLDLILEKSYHRMGSIFWFIVLWAIFWWLMQQNKNIQGAWAQGNYMGGYQLSHSQKVF